MKLTPVVLKQLRHLVGSANVLTDELSLSLYAYDCSVSRTRPDGVVVITEAAQVAPVLRVLHQFHIPFVPRGSATNHAGSCVALQGGIILSLTALNRILEINTQEKFAVVEPGVITGDLQQKLSSLGYFYAPDPASARVCTIGGNLAQNASGARCLKYGGTIDHVLEACVVLADGTEISVSRADLGPDWIGLLAGSEGTLGVITRLKVKILPLAKHVKTYLVSFPSLQASVQTVCDLAAHGVIPRCVEAMDQLTVCAIEEFAQAGYPTQAQALLILELDGSVAQINKEAKILEEICRAHQAQSFVPAATEEQRARLWRGRRSAFAAMARLSPNVMVGDGTVPRSRLPQALARVQQLLKQHHMQAGLLFHAGDGNFHPHLLFDERNKLQTANTARVLREILRICVAEQGTVSGEHGIGVEKRAVMAWQYDVGTLNLMACLKNALDPAHLANPLKILPHAFAEKARPALPLLPEVKRLQEKLLSDEQTQPPFVMVGQNTHLKTKQKRVLSSKTLQKILDIDTANYTVTAQAGVSLTTLVEALQKKGVGCLLPAKKGTLGGAFCSGQYPDFYTQVIGVEALLPDGTYVRYGGKLMKNAGGYPLTRLFAGSQGLFGLVTQLTFKVYANVPKTLTPRRFERVTLTELAKRVQHALNPQGRIANPEGIHA